MKAHFARFYIIFAFSTCQLRKRKSILAQKEQTYWSRPHTLLTRQTKKEGEKGFNTLVLPGRIQLPFTFLMAKQ